MAWPPPNPEPAPDFLPGYSMPASSSSCAIGLDVGGTKIAGGWVDLRNGAVLERLSIPSEPSRGTDAVLADLGALLERLLANGIARNWRPGTTDSSIGIALAELVSTEGRVQSSATFPWQNVSLKERLGLDMPVRLEADVRAFALAEARFGAGRGLQNFLAVTAGTGISSCLVIGGRPFPGARGLAGTMASQESCFPSVDGTLARALALESFASGPALAARLRAGRPEFCGTGRDVAELAARGDEDARRIVQTAGRALGAALGHLINVLDPQVVVLGGGVGLSGGLFREALLTSTRDHTWSPLLHALPIVPATTGHDAAWIGAALAAHSATNPIDP
jgi:glucokinase